jgi:hypothetical protein
MEVGLDGQMVQEIGTNHLQYRSLVSITAPTSTNNGQYFFSAGDYQSGSSPTFDIWNFGNPPFAITTGNEDANGYGNFEYAVPPGYYALCTKNLAEYG